MLGDLSKTLEKLLASEKEFKNMAFYYGNPAEIDLKRDIVSMFLYDIRENLSLRSNEPIVEYRGGEAVVHNPPVRIICSYIISMWRFDKNAYDEQQLLGHALKLFLRYSLIPEMFLAGELKTGQPAQLPIVTLSVDSIRNSSDFWAAHNLNVRPSFTVSVTVSVPEKEEAPSPVITQVFARYQAGGSETERARVRLGGRVLHDGRGVSGAFVEIKEAELIVKTNREGYYTFSDVPAGTYTVLVYAAGFNPVAKNNVAVMEGKQGDLIVVI